VIVYRCIGHHHPTSEMVNLASSPTSNHHHHLIHHYLVHPNSPPRSHRTLFHHLLSSFIHYIGVFKCYGWSCVADRSYLLLRGWWYVVVILCTHQWCEGGVVGIGVKVWIVNTNLLAARTISPLTSPICTISQHTHSAFLNRLFNHSPLLSSLTNSSSLLLTIDSLC
jgi:hypothetical protein